MTVTMPPRGPETERDCSLEERVAELEALIEEARRRARRRRQRNGGAALLVAAAGAAALIGFGGRGGGGVGTAAPTDGSGAGGEASSPAAGLAPLPGGNDASTFAFDPLRPNVVYVASAHGHGGAYVYKTTDGGAHWQQTAAHGTGWISDILSLTADPQHPGTLYAGTDTAVYKTLDGGRSWRPFNRGLFPAHGGRRICYPGGTGGGGYCVKLPVGIPGTTSWNRNNGWILDIAVDPVNSNVVYSASDAVRKSTDGGHSWKTVLQPFPTPWASVTRIAIAPTHPESIYAIAHTIAKGGTAIYKSTDTGRTWQPVGGGSRLPPSCCGDSEDALAVDAGTPQTLYAVVGNTVFATTDSGAHWQPMMNGLPANDISSLTADPRRAGTIYASVVINLNRVNRNAVHGAIYKTTDGGHTWNEVFSGFGVEKIAVDPKRPSTIYAAGWAGSDRTHRNEFRLLRSTDSGRTWTVAG